MKIAPRGPVSFGLLLVLLAITKFTMDALARRAGAFPISDDEIARLAYIRLFAETGNFSTYDYTWLPMPLFLAGSIGKVLGGAYLLVSLKLNALCCLLMGLAGAIAVRLSMEDEREQNRFSSWDYLIIPFLAGLLALATPLMPQMSNMLFAEPIAWGSFAIAQLGLIVACAGGMYFHAGLLMAGFATLVAVLTRYEAWPFAVGIPLSALMILFIARERPSKLLSLTTMTATTALCVGPVLWWLSVQHREMGNAFAPFGMTHGFVVDATGQPLRFQTAVDLLGSGAPYLILLPVFAIAALLPPRWTPRYALMALPPLLLVSLLLIQSFRSGTPWIYGFRTLGYGMAMLALCSVYTGAAHFRRLAAGECRAFDFRKLALATIYPGVLAYCLLAAMNSPEGRWEHIRLTAELIERAAERGNLADSEKIAIFPADRWDSGHSLLWPKSSQLIDSPPWILDEANPTELRDWFAANEVRIFATPDALPNTTRDALVARTYEPDTMHDLLKVARNRNDAILIFSVGHPRAPLPAEWNAYLWERGLEGTREGRDNWFRYSALLPPENSGIAATETFQDTWDARIVDLQINNAASPPPANLPTGYLLKAEPGDAGLSTVVRIGDQTFQPYTQALYIYTFDWSDGTIHERFSVAPDPRYAITEKALPLFVYLLE